jgi:GTPase SAR1 family protein
MPRSLVVEFIGMPGSGKSTLMHRALERLEARGLPVHVVPKGKPVGWEEVRRRPGILRKTKRTLGFAWFGFVLALRCPRLTWWYVRRRFASNGIDRGGPRPGLFHFLNFGQRYRLFHDAARRPGIHMSDRGGIVQTMAEIARHRPGDDGTWLLRSRSGSNPRLLAVLVECDTRTIQDRVRDRPGHPRARAHAGDPARFAETLERVGAWQRTAVRLAGDGAVEDFSVLTVDNSSPDQLDTAVARIVETIQERWSGPSLNPNPGWPAPRGS